MKILLDTNALLWILWGSKELGKKTRRTFLSSNTVYFSTLSIFELRVKQAKGKIKIDQKLVEELEARDVIELRPQASDATEVARFTSLIKHDSFDRMILAQAAANNLLLLTSDQKLLDLGFEWILNARD